MRSSWEELRHAFLFETLVEPLRLNVATLSYIWPPRYGSGDHRFEPVHRGARRAQHRTPQVRAHRLLGPCGREMRQHNGVAMRQLRRSGGEYAVVYREVTGPERLHR